MCVCVYSAPNDIRLGRIIMTIITLPSGQDKSIWVGWKKKGSESYSSRRGGGYMAIRIGHESVCLSLKVWVRSISSSMGRRMEDVDRRGGPER